MSLLISSILAGSLASTLFWLLAAFKVGPLVRQQPALHLATIYLTIASFVGLNAFTVAAVFKLLGSGPLGIMFGFVTGLQTVAGISAFLFVRRARVRP